MSHYNDENHLIQSLNDNILKNLCTTLLVVFISLFFINPLQAQFNPTDAAMGFSVFVKENFTFKAGKSTSAVAIGGNAILAGQADVAETSTGSYPFGPGNANNYGMVVGGQVVLQSGTYGIIRNGYLHIANTTGTSVVYNDCYNASQLINLKVVPYVDMTNGNVCNNAINQTPRFELQRQQATAVTSPHGLNFDSSFTVFSEVAAKMAKYVNGAAGTSNINFPTIFYNSQYDQNNQINPHVSLVNGKVNVLNLTGAQLQAYQSLIFDNTPNQTTPLVINVNQAGSSNFVWNAGYFSGLQDANSPYIIYNFYNNSGTIRITGNNPIRGTVIAATSNLEDNHNSYIYGQVIAKSFMQSNWSGVTFSQFTVTLPEVIVTPSVPFATAATNITHNSFTANWTTTTNTTGYKLDVSTSPSFSPGTFVAGFENLSVTTFNKTVTGLAENTTYYFRVRATNSNAISANSNTITVVTKYNTAITIFRTRASGNFSGTGTWSYNVNGTIFRDTTAHPLTTNKIEVAPGHQLTLDIDHTVASTATFYMAATSSMVVNAGKEFAVDGSANFNAQRVIFKSTAEGNASMGKITGTLLGASNVSVERFISAGRKWRLLTAPINGTTIHDAWQEGKSWDGVSANAATSTGTLITGQQQGTAANANANGFDYWAAIGSAAGSIKAYTKTAANVGSWNALSNTAGNFNGTTGYVVYIRGDRSISAGAGSTVLKATGELKDARLNISGTVTPTGFTLLGNPFASSIDFGEFYKTNAAVISNKFWAWDASLNIYGGFRLIDASTTGYETVPVIMSVPGSSIANTDYRYIESGQAFFVTPSGTQTTNQQVTFTQDHKTGNKPANSVFRNGNGKDEQLWINLNLLNGSSATLADGVKAKFSNEYKSAIDGDDVRKTSNMYENLSIYRNETDLTVEARTLIEVTDTLYLRLENTAARNYQFQLKSDNFLTSGLAAFFEDTYLKTSTPINLSGEITTVDFSVTTNTASTGANRFRIVFDVPKTLPVLLTSLKAYKQQQNVVVEWKVASESSMKKYEIEKSFDGRSFTKAFETAAKNNGTSTTYNWLDVSPVNGNNYYRIKMISNNGEVKYTEVVAVKMGGSKAEMAVYPNPVTNNVVSLQLSNVEKSIYTLQVINAAGQQVINQFVSHEGGSATQTVKLNKYLAPGIYQLTLQSKNSTFTQNIIVK